jgi:hypothetical protein
MTGVPAQPSAPWPRHWTPSAQTGQAQACLGLRGYLPDHTPKPRRSGTPPCRELADRSCAYHRLSPGTPTYQPLDCLLVCAPLPHDGCDVILWAFSIQKDSEVPVEYTCGPVGRQGVNWRGGGETQDATCLHLHHRRAVLRPTGGPRTGGGALPPTPVRLGVGLSSS